MASSAFARHYSRNHCCLLLLWVLRCFTSPRSLTPPYTFREQSPASRPVTFEVPPFGNPRIKARPPAPRGLSQVTTSFIGSWCLGIHRSHSVACRNTHVNRNYKDARVHYEVLNTRTEPHAARDEPARHTTADEEATARPLPHNPTACPQPALHKKTSPTRTTGTSRRTGPAPTRKPQQTREDRHP